MIRGSCLFCPSALCEQSILDRLPPPLRSSLLFRRSIHAYGQGYSGSMRAVAFMDQSHLIFAPSFQGLLKHSLGYILKKIYFVDFPSVIALIVVSLELVW